MKVAKFVFELMSTSNVHINMQIGIALGNGNNFQIMLLQQARESAIAYRCTHY